MTPEERIKKALEIAESNGTIDGAHHKMWTLDQMVRALTDCPVVEKQAVDVKGTSYTYKDMAESQEYLEWVHSQYSAGYDWDIGIAP